MITSECHFAQSLNIIFFWEKKRKAGIVAHVYNLSTSEAKEERLPLVLGQLELQNELGHFTHPHTHNSNSKFKTSLATS